MTRKLACLAALFAFVVCADSALAKSPAASNELAAAKPLKTKWLVIYYSSLKKRCFRGPGANHRAHAFLKRVIQVGGKAKMKCYRVKPSTRVCCVYYRVSRKVRVFRSLRAAWVFRLKLLKLGIKVILKKVKLP